MILTTRKRCLRQRWLTKCRPVFRQRAEYFEHRCIPTAHQVLSTRLSENTIPFIVFRCAIADNDAHRHTFASLFRMNRNMECAHHTIQKCEERRLREV